MPSSIAASHRTYDPPPSHLWWYGAPGHRLGDVVTHCHGGESAPARGRLDDWNSHPNRTVIGLEVEVGYIKHIRACVHSLHAVPLRAMIFQMCILFIVAQLTSISRSFWLSTSWPTVIWCAWSYGAQIPGDSAKERETQALPAGGGCVLQRSHRTIIITSSIYNLWGGTLLLSFHFWPITRGDRAGELLTVRWEGGDKAPSYVL